MVKVYLTFIHNICTLSIFDTQLLEVKIVTLIQVIIQNQTIYYHSDLIVKYASIQL